MATTAAIQSAIQRFGSSPLPDAATNLFATLGYRSDKQLDLPSSPEAFFNQIDTAGSLNRTNARLSDWNDAHFLFQLTNDEIPSLAHGQISLITGDTGYHKGMIESFVFLAIELNGEEWTRTALSRITREVNRAFPMPAILLFRHGGLISIAVIDRRINRRDASRDVIDSRRIAIIKDVRIDNPHRAHVEILRDLALANVGDRHTPSNFRDLYDAWLKVLSVKELNKRFYDELFTWYRWAIRNVTFPKGQVSASPDRPEYEAQVSVAVIRLLTRLIFLWFIKEKGVVPEDLFRPDRLNDLLKEPPTANPDSSSYYKAILQNLFFATLNTEQGDRRWKSDAAGMNNQYLVHSVYRYKSYFTNSDLAFGLFREVPYLNGGLFECLDRDISQRDLQRHPDLEEVVVKEGNGTVLRVDGYSDRSGNPLRVPNRLFFSEGEEIDLNQEMGTKNRKRTARGLVEIFGRYKFTIEENTPIEEEVALDPELLGKVFENLLASYNEDTRTTARKQSGSFYTPREVVDYMVDETLIAYFETGLRSSQEPEPLAPKLKQLLAFGAQEHDFTEAEVDALTAAIENVKVLDPACGSGAFPMGMLQKLVHVLGKLDPDNSHWRAQNRAPLERQLKEAESIPDPTLRETKIEEAEEELNKLDRAFSDRHYADYSRKLYLIEKCLFGVDIQPIAVQIAKLRFFISLVVSQKVDRDVENANFTPLPNLETKLVAANTLIPLDSGQLLLRTQDVLAKEDEIQVANERHFAARTTRTKRKWRERIYELRDQLADLLEQDQILPHDKAIIAGRWDPFDQNQHADFFDPRWMFGLHEGFDIVLGNPPYVRQEDIKEQKPQFKEIYDCYSGTADLYVYFYERSIRLLKPGGAFAFITSNKWFRTGYGEKLREWMNRNTLIRRIIDFGDEPVFTALAYPTIVIATRRERPVVRPAEEDQVIAFNWEGGPQIESFPDLFAAKAFPVPQSELRSSGWQIERQYSRELLARIKSVGTPLLAWCNRRIYAGIKTGLNDAFIVDGLVRRDILTECPDAVHLFVPCLRGRDVKRWHVNKEDIWLIKVESSENASHPWSGLSPLEAWRRFATLYPALAQHFNRYVRGLQDRQDHGTYFWELRSCAFWSEFLMPKVFMPSIEKSPMYAPVIQEYYGNNKTHFVATNEWHFLSAILNSGVSGWFTQQVFTAKQGGYFEFIPQFVGQIPIPDASELQRAVVKTVVEIILTATSSIAYWEQFLNGLVYELFFPEDLHTHGIRLFEVTEQLGLVSTSDVKPDVILQIAQQAASALFRNDHPVYRMLFDLQAVPVVRTIEGKE